MSVASDPERYESLVEVFRHEPPLRQVQGHRLMFAVPMTALRYFGASVVLLMISSEIPVASELVDLLPLWAKAVLIGLVTFVGTVWSPEGRPVHLTVLSLLSSALDGRCQIAYRRSRPTWKMKNPWIVPLLVKGDQRASRVEAGELRARCGEEPAKLTFAYPMGKRRGKDAVELAQLSDEWLPPAKRLALKLKPGRSIRFVEPQKVDSR